MPDTKHTPESLDWNGNEITDEKGISAAGIAPEQPDEFAERIVKSYNCHAELLEALASLLGVFEKYAEDWEPGSEGVDILKQARDAIAKAEGA